MTTPTRTETIKAATKENIKSLGAYHFQGFSRQSVWNAAQAIISHQATIDGLVTDDSHDVDMVVNNIVNSAFDNARHN